MVLAELQIVAYLSSIGSFLLALPKKAYGAVYADKLRTLKGTKALPHYLNEEFNINYPRPFEYPPELDITHFPDGYYFKIVDERPDGFKIVIGEHHGCRFRVGDIDLSARENHFTWRAVGVFKKGKT